MAQLHSAVLLMVALSLGGCVISVRDHDDEDWHQSDADDWRLRQERNQQAIHQLELGRSVDSITRELGPPDMSESFVRDGRTFRVLLYRTRLAHSDGRLTRDETTPLVFVDGELVGWGESALAYAMP